MNDDQYADEYSGLCAADRAAIAALADSAEQDEMDRFQDPDNGWAYTITVDFDMASKLEAQMLADIVRISVRKHIDGDARVTFEAHEALGSEVLVPRFQHPAYSGTIINP